MPCLYLRESDVDRLADMPLAICAMREAFAMLASGDADNVPRVRAKAPGIVLHSMIAAATSLGLVGWKQYTTTRQGAKFLVGLQEQTSGRLVALMESNRLGQLRTGAVTGLAVSLLANADADQIGLFGSGWQAQSQLEAVACIGRLQRVLVYSRSDTRRRAFCEMMSRRLGLLVEPADDASATISGMPIVITATASATPLFDGKNLAPGSLVCAIGSNWLEKAEIDLAAVRSANRVVCDSIKACQNEAGDLVAAVEQGAFSWSDAVEFADVVAKRVAPRAHRDDRIVFKSVGLAIEDVVFASKILQRATERGIGETLPIGE